MTPLTCEVVTAERLLFSGEVDLVLAPGIEGQLGILPNHAPLITALLPGELIVRQGDEEIVFAVGGGFLEVVHNKVTVLADSAERAEEIDVERALAAKRRAEERLAQRRAEDIDHARAEAALRRAMARLRAAEYAKRRRRRERPPQG
ncbi:MAG: F0F1 ATP synthase subunit epsilon [Anaerolineae bacterium]|nr:F0F1 ATP synthase subunit epsilon [Anaerolineae bacterium]